jgi:hypothetical protein
MVSRPASSQAIKIQFFQKKRQKFTRVASYREKRHNEEFLLRALIKRRWKNALFSKMG